MEYPRNSSKVIDQMIETIFTAVRLGLISMSDGADKIAAIRSVEKLMGLR